VPGRHINHAVLDDYHTERLAPQERHWALTIDPSAYYAYALCLGIAFTYLGLKSDERATVRFRGRASPNLFVAGEMIAGNVMGRRYGGGRDVEWHGIRTDWGKRAERTAKGQIIKSGGAYAAA
jgi:tricarballylate dehydrogenase